MLILVEGVPGAGKSSTVRHLRDALEAAGPGLSQFVGRYTDETNGQQPVYEVACDQDVLVLVGLLWFGERCRLVRRGPCPFNLESFPSTLTFHLDERGRPQQMTLAGPDLLFGRSGDPRVFKRTDRAP